MRYVIKNLRNQPLEVNVHGGSNGNFSSPPSNGGLGNGTDHNPMDSSKIKLEPSQSNGVNGRSNTLRSQFDDFSQFSNAVLDDSMQKSTAILNLVSDQPKHKRRKHEKNLKNSKEKVVDDCEVLLESSSNDSISTEIDSEVSFLGREKELNSQTGEVDDIEEMLKAAAGPPRTDIKLKKPKEMKKSPSRNSLIMDLTDGKGLVPPSVTITPITSNTPNISSVLERRPGIEIIPLTSSSNISSSITITPISNATDKEERKNCKNRNFDDKSREKKRKRKKEDDSASKMGPPEKVPAKSDPLSKPVSVSIIKPATDSPPGINRPSSPSLRKYSASPTQFREKSSASSFQPSPKHSPACSSSPKHSPKHGTNSPKQASSSSGKPSMSTLKSASGSPTSLKNVDAKSKTVSSGSSSNSSKEQRDKDSSRKGSGNSSSCCSTGSPKIKSSSVKLKQLDISNELTANSSGRNTPPNNASCGDTKNLNNPLQRNRKGSLSAVIDKLKSAQEVGDPVAVGARRDTSNTGSSKDGKITSSLSGNISSKTGGIDGKALTIQKIPDGVKNPGEYMVKQSSDGMKLLINKKSKESSKTTKSSSSWGAGTPKTHTGLKPGVISGPASKKPSSKSNVISATSSKTPNSATKSSPVKGSLSRSLSSKGSSSPKMPISGIAELSRKENANKSRSLKINSDKGLFKDSARKGSPALPRDEDHDRVIKNLKLDTALPPSLVVEGLIKPFDTKFQIPKLSARNNNINSNIPSNVSNNSSIFVNNNLSSNTNVSGIGTSNSSGENISSMLNNSETVCSNSNNSSGNSVTVSEGLGVSQATLDSIDSTTSVNNNNIKSSSEKPSEKHEVKIDMLTNKTSLDLAANLKYQTSKLDAKIPNSNMSKLLSLPVALTNVSPKLPMTSPNLPTTSLSSITSKLDRNDDSVVMDASFGEKVEVDPNSTVDVTTVNFQSASLTKTDDLKKAGDVPKHLLSQPSEILLDFSPNITGKILSDKSDKTLVGTTPFIKPNSPVIFHKSPGQSPINVQQSPQSITDDELMDEALMLRK